MKKVFIPIIIIAVILFIISYYFIKDKDIENEPALVLKNDVKEVKESIDCYVDIKGAIVNPNVYKCDENNKIIDIINIAGGLKEDADVSIINLSKKVYDQMVIIIYTKQQISEAKARLNEPKIVEIIKEIEKECNCLDDINDGCINENNNNTNKVNINTASKDLLMTLSGIGESKANAIIEYRTSTPFTNITDIKNVSGIGDSLFESIKNYITV